MDERYEQQNEIGRGGIGTVYKGLHSLLRRDVAIKELREIFSVFGDIQKDSIIEKFERCVQEHARLVHPNIIQILDIDTDRQYPIFVMEHAPGGSLRELLSRPEKPSLSERLNIFLQVAQALRYAHRLGVIHGDLKPENVLFDAENNVKVVDFGLTRIIERDSRSQQIYVGVGTVAYLSPEQFRNPADVTYQSDIYSLGIIFYEMLTGKLPGRRSPMPSSFYPNIPRKLDDIFDNMCMDAEEDRYASVDAMLEEFMASEEVTALLGRPIAISTGAPAAAPPAPPAPTPMTAPAPSAVAPVAPVATYTSSASIPAARPASSSAMPAVRPASSSAMPAVSAAPPAPAASDDDGGDDSDILAKLNKYSNKF